MVIVNDQVFLAPWLGSGSILLLLDDFQHPAYLSFSLPVSASLRAQGGGTVAVRPQAPAPGMFFFPIAEVSPKGGGRQGKELAFLLSPPGPATEKGAWKPESIRPPGPQSRILIVAGTETDPAHLPFLLPTETSCP